MSKPQPMPILDRLYPNASYEAEEKAQRLKPCKVSNEVFNILSGCKRFKLDDNQRVTGWNPDTSKFGDLRLPYPYMWIEWNNQRDPSNPNTWQAVLCAPLMDMPRVSSHLFGKHISTDKLEEMNRRFFEKNKDGCDLDASWGVLGFALLNGKPYLMESRLSVLFDKNQNYTGMSGYVSSGHDLSPLEQTADMVDLFWDVLVAIGWINCKNVTTQEHERHVNPKKQRRKPNATKAQGLKYSTIHLPNETHSNGTKGSNGTNCEKSLHTVRGHFKTFTEDKPLLGKHVGTYWWGWQVRGSKEIGETISDYRVNAP